MDIPRREKLKRYTLQQLQDILSHYGLPIFDTIDQCIDAIMAHKKKAINNELESEIEESCASESNDPPKVLEELDSLKSAVNHLTENMKQIQELFLQQLGSSKKEETGTSQPSSHHQRSQPTVSTVPTNPVADRASTLSTVPEP